MTKAKAAALSQMKKPLMVLLHLSLVDGSENVSAILWKCLVNDSAKTEELKRATGQTIRVSSLPEQGVKGNAVLFGGVKRRQALFGMMG